MIRCHTCYYCANTVTAIASNSGLESHEEDFCAPTVKLNSIFFPQQILKSESKSKAITPLCTDAPQSHTVLRNPSQKMNRFLSFILRHSGLIEKDVNICCIMMDVQRFSKGFELEMLVYADFH